MLRPLLSSWLQTDFPDVDALTAHIVASVGFLGAAAVAADTPSR